MSIACSGCVREVSSSAARHLHRVRGADQREMRHALRRARRRLQRDQRAEAVADQRGPLHTRRIEQRQHEVGRVLDARAAARPRCGNGPAGRRASTFQPWCANQRVCRIQTLWSFSTPWMNTTVAGRGRTACRRCSRRSRAPLTSRSMRARLFRGLQRALQVVDQVVRVFQPDRQADRARADAGGGQRLVVHAEVRGAGRVDHQRAAVADVGQVAEKSSAPR